MARDALQFPVVGSPFGLTSNRFMWIWVDWGRPWESHRDPGGTLKESGEPGGHQGAAWLGNWPGEGEGRFRGVTEGNFELHQLSLLTDLELIPGCCEFFLVHHLNHGHAVTWLCSVATAGAHFATFVPSEPTTCLAQNGTNT